MKCSVVMMAHPVREQAVVELLESMDRTPEVVWDANPTPSADPEQRWETGRRAWQAIDPISDWGLVIQDDVLVGADLTAGLEQALTNLPDGGLVSAYTGTGRPDQSSVSRALNLARSHGWAWACTRSLNWGPAIAMPTVEIEAMLDWCSQPGRGHWNYDYKIGVYFRDIRRWRTWYTVPSLVEHRGLPSLVGHDTGPARTAHQFIGEGVSALGVDFSRTPPGGLVPTHP